MNTGVSFQPGASDGPMGQSRPQSSPSNNIQEAIKVLSLRLPKVVGARGIAPTPLLSSQGSNGNTRVDSVVNQIMSRMFPTAGAAPGSAPAPMLPNAEPGAPSNAPSFGGASVAPYQPQQAQPQQAQPFSTPPRVIVGGVGPVGDGDVVPDGGSQTGAPPSAAPMPGVYEDAPDLTAFTDWLTNRSTPPDNGGGWGSGGGGSDSWI